MSVVCACVKGGGLPQKTLHEYLLTYSHTHTRARAHAHAHAHAHKQLGVDEEDEEGNELLRLPCRHIFHEVC